MQYLAYPFNDNTIRFLLRYPGRVDAGLLCEAAKKVISGADVLHASFHCDGNQTYWKCNDTYEKSDYFRCVTAGNDPFSTALALAAEPILHGGKVQLRCSLVQGNGESIVVLNLSHLCMDGSDGKYLLGKLAEAYNLLAKTGSCDGLQVKNGDRRAEQIYDRLSKKEILSLCRNPMTGVKSIYPFGDGERGTPCIVTKTISEKTMTAARRRAKASGATANDLLLTACYHAYAKVKGTSDIPMSVMSMMDLRHHPKVGDSRGLSNIAGSLPTVLREGISADFTDTLAKIASQTAALKERPLGGMEGMPLLHTAAKGLPMWFLMKANNRLYKNMSLGMTNLGNLSGQEYALDGLAPVSGLFGGPLKQKPSVQVSVLSLDGTCALTIAGAYKEEDIRSLEGFLEDMVRMIGEYASGKDDIR